MLSMIELTGIVYRENKEDLTEKHASMLEHQFRVWLNSKGLTYEGEFKYHPPREVDDDDSLWIAEQEQHDNRTE